MLSFVQQVMEQYQPLIAKMYVNVMKCNIAIENLSPFFDLELILELHVIFPLLDYMHALIKLTKSCHIFVYDFIDVVKVC
jgi:hypothetical protein